MTERYSRHNLIDWFDQERLKATRIVVVGAGAVGNEVIKNLVLLGVGHIDVFDFDRIEEHNLTRSILFHESDIGSYKADVAAASCKLIDPNVTVMPRNMDFWNGLTLDDVSDADAVVCCVDNFEARILLNQLCLITGTDLYNTGIDSRYSSVEVFPFSTRPDCACYECTLPTSVYVSIQKRYSCGWLQRVALDEKKIPTTAITSSLAGAIAVSIILNRLTAHDQGIQDAVRYFQNTVSLESTVSVLQRNDDCPACRKFDPHAQRIRTKRYCATSPILPLIGGSDVEVVLSEPVVLRATCSLCHREQEYFQSARLLTDAIMFCSACGKYSVKVEFAERLSVGDFEKAFAGRSVPCKFLTFHIDNQQVIIELED